MSIFTNPEKVLAEDLADIKAFFTDDAWPFIKGILTQVEAVGVPIAEADVAQDVTTAATAIVSGQSVSAVAAQAGANILAQGVALGQKLAQTAATATADAVETEMTPPAAASSPATGA